MGRSGEEDEADGVGAGCGQIGSDRLPEEGVGHLEEDARPVARVLLGARGAAVVEALEGGESGPDDRVRGGSAQRRDEGQAAGVVFIRRIVESGSRSIRSEDAHIPSLGHAALRGAMVKTLQSIEKASPMITLPHPSAYPGDRHADAGAHERTRVHYHFLGS